jgi:glyoxalase family protein
MKPIQGLHHVTAMAGDPQANLEFYHGLLGQRLVKKTVNFDDPGTYHFYFADEIGTPGTILTFFPWPMAKRGVPGNGETTAVAYTIRPESVDYWRDRLAGQGVVVGQSLTRFGREVIPFRDPAGLRVELVIDERPATVLHWARGPVPATHALRGFHSVTLQLAEVEPTAELLTAHMGCTFVGQDGETYRFAGALDDAGQLIDIDHRPGAAAGRFGAGSIHHIAFRTVDDTEQLQYQAALRAVGLDVTPVRDRQYFHSIYFRSPGGVLFEIATNSPGFIYDENVAELGQSLTLPPWLEDRRSEIEEALPAVRPVD